MITWINRDRFFMYTFQRNHVIQAECAGCDALSEEVNELKQQLHLVEFEHDEKIERIIELESEKARDKRLI